MIEKHILEFGALPAFEDMVTESKASTSAGMKLFF
jgi:hypothetical protein